MTNTQGCPRISTCMYTVHTLSNTLIYKHRNTQKKEKGKEQGKEVRSRAQKREENENTS